MVNEALMREAVRKLVPHIVVAKKYGQTVRISEANSMTGEGSAEEEEVVQLIKQLSST
jgi:hypothetical protein